MARSPCNQVRDCDRRVSCHASITSLTSPAFEVTSKRRKGYPSETNVKRGLRFVRGGEVELVEKLGRKDRCPCGSGLSFQTLLPAIRPVSTGRSGMIIGGIRGGLGDAVAVWELCGLSPSLGGLANCHCNSTLTPSRRHPAFCSGKPHLSQAL